MKEHAQGHPAAELDANQAGRLIRPLELKSGSTRFLFSFLLPLSEKCRPGPTSLQTGPLEVSPWIPSLFLSSESQEAGSLHSLK